MTSAAIEAPAEAPWHPRPPSPATETMRHDYYAGYSDGFYGYHFGAGHAEPDSNCYRLGYTHGRADAA